MRDARDFLADPDRIVVFDGAMGTMLYQRGVYINQCYDEVVLKSPELVTDIHRAYLKAGAEILETNTFGATRYKLAHYGLETHVASINERAARLAGQAARARVAAAPALL